MSLSGPVLWLITAILVIGGPVICYRYVKGVLEDDRILREARAESPEEFKASERRAALTMVVVALVTVPIFFVVREPFTTWGAFAFVAVLNAFGAYALFSNVKR